MVGLVIIQLSVSKTDHIQQPHAEASNFKAGISKREAYNQVLESLKSLLDNQRNWVCNTANAASLLWHLFHSLPPPSSEVNWAGFYVADGQRKDTAQLILGPFQGKVACQTIRIGSGVCGTVAKTGKSLRVDNVETFPGHIACDGASKSEIVVPVTLNGNVVAVIDVDCAQLRGFDEIDQSGLEEMARMLALACDW